MSNKDPYLAARLADAAQRAERTGQAVFTSFLDPAQAEQARMVAQAQRVHLHLWGGYADAERRIACFCDSTEAPADGVWPMVWLHCQWNARYANLTHRDLLGSLMGQGIEREKLGDILVFEGDAYCASLPQIAEYLTDSLTQAGRATLRTTLLQGEPPLPQPKTATRRDTVASLRLDAVLAAGWNLSRAQAQELIHQGKVLVNHVPQERADFVLAQGAMISARGMGRLRIAETRPTPKGRMGIVFLLEK